MSGPISQGRHCCTQLRRTNKSTDGWTSGETLRSRDKLADDVKLANGSIEAQPNKGFWSYGAEEMLPCDTTIMMDSATTTTITITARTGSGESLLQDVKTAALSQAARQKICPTRSHTMQNSSSSGTENILDTLTGINYK